MRLLFCVLLILRFDINYVFFYPTVAVANGVCVKERGADRQRQSACNKQAELQTCSHTALCNANLHGWTISTLCSRRRSVEDPCKVHKLVN